MKVEAQTAKRTCRRLERRFRRTQRDDDKKAFAAARTKAREKISQSRADKLKEQVAESAGDPAKMWRTTRRLLHSAPSCNLDDDECMTMSKAFGQFFIDKISNIRNAITVALSSNTDQIKPIDRTNNGPHLSEFSEVKVDEVIKLFNSMPNKSSPLDVLPTSLLKSCSNVFAPIVARLANLSFTEGQFPSSLKTAQVLPLLKKPGLDRSAPANYRPISNLSTVSKVIERLALARLKPHVYSSSNFNPLQSAYRPGHSTETALLHILNSLYEAIDSKKLTVLIGLDLSAAFDTVDYDILVERLRSDFGINNMVLKWIESYLMNRKQYVKLGRHCSETTVCSAGVPQGSVLGPILFALYVSPVGAVISSYGVQYHQYADDTQLFYALKASSIETDITILETCSRAVKRWFLENGLQLNPDKSEAMFAGTAQQLSAVKNVKHVSVAGAVIPVRTELKSLGVTLDCRLTFGAHVNTVAKACNYHMWSLRHIRHLLTYDIALTLACSLVGAKLDYCNAVLYGAPDTSIAVLQRVQNSLARIVLQQPKCSHATPLLRSLHWLPMKKRIEFKLAFLTYKLRLTSTPIYLARLLSDKTTNGAMTLRSSSKPQLTETRTRTDYGARAFRVAAPKIWNTLPADIQLAPCLTTFKKRLKTSLFAAAYDC